VSVNKRRIVFDRHIWGLMDMIEVKINVPELFDQTNLQCGFRTRGVRTDRRLMASRGGFIYESRR
jgi:hypothetical protein